MYDDVRLAVRHLPVRFIGGVSFDDSGFGIAPALTPSNVSERIRAALQAIREAA
jgi:hypothetical protein